MKKTTIQPRGKYMLLLPEPAQSRKNEYGLITPESVEQEQKAYGTIVAVGDEIKGIKKGDRVIYGVFAGESIKIKEGGKEVEYKLLYDDDVIAFLK